MSYFVGVGVRYDIMVRWVMSGIDKFWIERSVRPAFQYQTFKKTVAPCLTRGLAIFSMGLAIRAVFLAEAQAKPRIKCAATRLGMTGIAKFSVVPARSVSHQKRSLVHF
jgi:hypothetical protein